MTDFLARLADYPVMEVMFILAVLLVLIDYFFPVDYPAFLGYLCFAGGIFFAAPWTWGPSLVAAVVVWVALLVMHRLWFTSFLTNAPGRS